MKTFFAFFALFAFFAVVSGCSKIPDDMVIAQMNARPITMRQFRETQLRGEGAPEAEIFRQLLMREALLDRAQTNRLTILQDKVIAQVKSSGMDPSPVLLKIIEEQMLVELVISQEVAPHISVTDDEVQSYFQDHGDEFKSGNRLAIRQILLKSKALAEDVRREVVNDSSQFVALAERHSVAPERKRGGFIGIFDEAEVPAMFSAVVRTLAAGAVSPVVETPYGFHLLQITERRPAASNSIETARPVIVKRLEADARERALREWFRSTVRCSVHPKFAKLIGWQLSKR